MSSLLHQDLSVLYASETPDHADAIEGIAAEAFGPGRFTRAAERVREQQPHDPTLSVVAFLDGEVVGSVRQTRVRIGATPAVMLGPLAVRPLFTRRGIGGKLMRRAADAARRNGERLIFLVGDRAYYEPFGYQPLPVGSVRMPGPVDERRILGLALVPGALLGVNGAVMPRR